MKKNHQQRHEQAPKELFDKPAIRIPNPIMPIRDIPNAAWDQVNPKLRVQWIAPRKESSQIKAYTYSDQEALLVVKFMTGTVYSYQKVPLGVFQAMLVIDNGQFDSLGSWLSQNITSKKDQYPYTREN